MAWNEPGKGNGDKDPWGNRNNQNGGPPDLDDMLKKLWGQISGGGNNRSGSSSGKSQSPFTKATIYASRDRRGPVQQQRDSTALRNPNWSWSRAGRGQERRP